jgi:hypothetical protein
VDLENFQQKEVFMAAPSKEELEKLKKKARAMGSRQYGDPKPSK